MLIENIGLAISALSSTDILGLLQGDHRGNRVAIRKIFIVILAARALNKGDIAQEPCLLWQVSQIRHW